jgi:hypothetical protein
MTTRTISRAEARRRLANRWQTVIREHPELADSFTLELFLDEDSIRAVQREDLYRRYRTLISAWMLPDDGARQ